MVFLSYGKRYERCRCTLGLLRPELGLDPEGFLSEPEDTSAEHVSKAVVHPGSVVDVFSES